MNSISKSVLPFTAALAGALMLAGCGSKKDETVPAATDSAAPSNLATDGSGGAVPEADTSDNAMHDAMKDKEQMERHHRQEMDHDAMRQGGMNQGAPATDPAPMNQATPMKDM
ncbi:hypothetical protein CA262_06145 [Sphingobium sp. GW456-12-10-14-TSB1]|uniref:hypothetical protein n=1 Tax=Sphingobium sp. GW456-12-10-14-TSB1 TaxID=1987165 RepID=UPI000A3BA606|nr:hypothetical protein [Sphingobium sp. GW456-12-10-14-TSB1]MBS88189.1 hypothetical protein [Sphingobium sp.]OUC54492.1 hypothetical protein CA262_06145 [Sphingobium sp. GW456-12-10-14-TSB1]